MPGLTRILPAVVAAMALLAAACGGGTDSTVIGADGASHDRGAEPPVGFELAGGGDVSVRPASGQVTERTRRLPVEAQIMVDQFGYLPDMTKVAVLADPVRGANADVRFVPGRRYQVRDAATGEIVHRGRPVQWRDGRVDPRAGDRGWWYDFSEVTTPGSYYVVDVGRRVRSATFEIGPDVYHDVLDAALKAFWFNRANVVHQRRFAGPWRGGAVAAGPRQDGAARSVDRRGPATALDLRGGWFDAGDTTKYVTFAMSAVHQLLTAWERHPDAFDDAVGIPESGNGRPDIVDEVMVELRWLETMQRPSGGVLTKVGWIDYDGVTPPQRDRRPRFYEEVCSSSTIAAAGMFAHGALALNEIAPAATARWADRAIRAWDWYRSNPIRTDCDPQIVTSGDADLSAAEQDRAATMAAIYLFALTGEQRFADAVAEGVTRMRPWVETAWNRYEGEQADALVFYLGLPDADPDVVRVIEERLAFVAGNPAVHGEAPRRSLYRAPMTRASLHWGSNKVVLDIGTGNAVLAELGVDPDRTDSFRRRAAAQLHMIHGVNPLGLVYLSNMAGHGAERSVDEIYHFRFGDGTRFDGASSGVGPPPGYVVGGPNARYSGQARPPRGEPPLKAYRDFNTDSLAAVSWEVSEPSISYQASYIRLLAALIAPA
ncbi:MAG: glycoside hydrolase family 9 protein [Acidimicrobiales bacterium]